MQVSRKNARGILFEISPFVLSLKKQTNPGTGGFVPVMCIETETNQKRGKKESGGGG